MFAYTTAALSLITDTVKKFTKFFKIALSILTLAYLIIAIVTDIGIFFVNITLLALYTVYTVFLLFFQKKVSKSNKASIAHLYRFTRLAFKAITLGSTLYTIWLTSTDVSGIKLIVTTLLLLLWILQFVTELALSIIEPKITLLTAAIQQDLKPIILAHDALSPTSKDFNVNYDEVEKIVAPIAHIAKQNKKKSAVKAATLAVCPPLLLIPKRKNKKEKKQK